MVIYFRGIVNWLGARGIKDLESFGQQVLVKHNTVVRSDYKFYMQMLWFFFVPAFWYKI